MKKRPMLVWVISFDDPTEWGDLDEDGIGDNSDDDDDNDGLSDVDELTVYNSSPYNIDGPRWSERQ